MNCLETLQQRYPWPDTRPDVPEDWTGWCGGDNRRAFGELLGDNSRVILELGVYFGLSTKYLAEAAPNATILSVDHFAGSVKQLANPKDWIRPELLYPTFCRNLWPHRARIIPMRTTIGKAMHEIHELGIVPDLLYVDGEHDEASVFHDVSLALKLFPQTQILGDDWMHPTVRMGVVKATMQCKQLRVFGCNCWWVPMEDRRR